MLAHGLFHLTPRTCRVRPFGQFRQGPRPKVRRQDDQRLLKVHRAALTIGQDAIIQHLQQHVEHIRVGLFHLIEQHHLIGPPPHRFGQHAALIIADIARRRADQPRDRVFLHEFRHVDADHRVFIVEKIGGDRFGQLGLADAGGPEEQEAAQRPPLVVQPSARPADSVGNRHHGGTLADHPLAKLFLHPQQLFAFAFQHFRGGNAGPAFHNLSNLFRPHGFGDQSLPLTGLGFGQGFLQAGDAAILQLTRFAEIAFTLGLLQLGAGAVQLLFQVTGLFQAVAL